MVTTKSVLWVQDGTCGKYTNAEGDPCDPKPKYDQSAPRMSPEDLRAAVIDQADTYGYISKYNWRMMNRKIRSIYHQSTGEPDLLPETIRNRIDFVKQSRLRSCFKDLMRNCGFSAFHIL